ncbi:MAG: hypothetical protein JSR98_12775 [Proteobacteria bacterium]|nr:hypothetical protein [Pseudomonadota bacterium]
MEPQDVPGSEPQAYPTAPLDEDIAVALRFQEINERRARVENSELLQHLRGL